MHIFYKIISFPVKYFFPIFYWRKKGAIIGNNCCIFPHASLGSEPYLISIGNHVRINNGVKFFTHDGGVWVLRMNIKSELFSSDLKNVDLFGSIKIGNNVHLGTDAIILPGVTIGDNVIIGCGAVVTRNIPNNSVAVGVPAKIIETIDDYYLKHQNDFVYIRNFSQKNKKKFLKEKFKNPDHAGN